MSVCVASSHIFFWMDGNLDVLKQKEIKIIIICSMSVLQSSYTYMKLRNNEYNYRSFFLFYPFSSLIHRLNKIQYNTIQYFACLHRNININFYSFSFLYTQHTHHIVQVQFDGVKVRRPEYILTHISVSKCRLLCILLRRSCFVILSRCRLRI